MKENIIFGSANKENTAPKLPFLVYGTLRPGCGNYYGILRGHTVREETVVIEGYEMWGAGGCPFVIKNDNPESKVVGTLIYVDEDKYEKVQKRLDQLEGYRGVGELNWYERRTVTVQSEDGPVEAWIYVVEGSTAQNVRNQYRLITGGDWIQHKEAERSFNAMSL